jgi:hypothetical protein
LFETEMTFSRKDYPDFSNNAWDGLWYFLRRLSKAGCRGHDRVCSGNKN